MGKTFREWNPEQGTMFPARPIDFVGKDHVAMFIRSLVNEQLDLSAILSQYQEERGYPPYHPVMMTALLLYS
jgi:transposase